MVLVLFFLESCCFLPIILFPHLPSSKWHFTFFKKKKKKKRKKILIVSVLSKNCVMKHLKVKDGMNECSWGSQDHKGQHWGEGLREPVACPLCERRGSLGLKR